MQALRTHQKRMQVTPQAIAAILLLAGLLAGGIYVWRRPATPAPHIDAALVIDASPTAAQKRRCADVERLGALILREAKGTARLSVYATGDKTSGGEPIRLGVVTKERQPTLLEQSGDTAEPFLRELGRLCESVPLRGESPIFQAVASVSRTFAPEECAQPAHSCRLWVRTDGLEESDPRVMAALRPERHPRRRSRRPAQAHHAPRIDNSALDVAFCGLSERSVTGYRRHTLPAIEQIARAWRREFARPDRVRFQTICAPYEVATRQSEGATVSKEK